ncbi:MAG TPA: alanine--tRNA ligase [Patescibacteria group bacterium]
MLTHVQLRKKFAEFWKNNNHKEVPPIPLVPQNDPTTLFTGFGMQPLVPYLLGEPHPQGNRLYNVQPCFRSQDIDEVGDNRHTTFFEMMGNWSLGDYFKKEQLEWFWKFLTEEIKLPKEKLYVTVFAGDKKNDLPADEESIKIWKKLGIQENKIFKYGPEKNWWSRAGVPDNMPVGEPGGPDSEVFFEFTQVSHDKKFGDKCHPNCDCGRFLEIGNSVFMQYKKTDKGFEELPKKNVDFGGGLERILAAANNDLDMFKTDVFFPIISTIEKESGIKYLDNHQAMQIITDHFKASVFIGLENIEPNNKDRGYVMRRLIRRSVVKMLEIKINPIKSWPKIYQSIAEIYQLEKNVRIETIIGKEIDSFIKTVDKGTKMLQTSKEIDGELLFNLKQSYGFPIEIAIELLDKWKIPYKKNIVLKQYKEKLISHINLSKKSSTGMFKGGLADQSEQTIKYHTATHLLHQALFDTLSDSVRQEGSNITGERLRFDFYSVTKPTQEQIKKIEKNINDKIREKLPVTYKIVPKSEALKLGAKSFFREKYPDMVKVYFIENYSKEFCGGPHVKNTSEIGKIEIYKFEKIGSNLYRIYAK